MRLARCGTIFLDAAPEVARRTRKLVELAREPNPNRINDAEAIAKALAQYVQDQKPGHHGNGSTLHDGPREAQPALTPHIEEKGHQSCV